MSDTTPEEMIAKLTAIETIVHRLDHELLGNGQPGKIAMLEKKIEAQGEAFEKRVIPLENWRSALGGAMALIILAISIYAAVKH